MKVLSIVVPTTDQEKANHDPLHHLRTMDGKLTEDGEALAGLAIQLLSDVCFKNSEAHGWYEKYLETYVAGEDDFGNNIMGERLAQRNFGEVMALITSEVSEAFEAYRDGDDQTKISYKHFIDYCEWIVTDTPTFKDGNMTEATLGKPEGIASELADILIRVFDYAGAYGIPLGEAVIRKHFYNQTRPYRHGGKLA